MFQWLPSSFDFPYLLVSSTTRVNICLLLSGLEGERNLSREPTMEIFLNWVGRNRDSISGTWGKRNGRGIAASVSRVPRLSCLMRYQAVDRFNRVNRVGRVVENFDPLSRWPPW
jgi:hypothetical protein